MTSLTILAAWTLASIPLALLVGRFMSPSPCERDEDRASDVDAELNGRRLPTRMIDLNHNGSIYS